MKPRRNQYGQDDHIAYGTSRGLLSPLARQLPIAARNAERTGAVRLRRSVSMQNIPRPESRNESKAPESVQDVLKSINALNDYVSGIKFKPDNRRHRIRREVMQAQVHEFKLDKPLESVLYAIYKAKNDLKEVEERSSEDEIFRQSVIQAVQLGTRPPNATAFSILKNKYKSRSGMGDTAAGITAGASVLAIPVAKAVQKLTSNFILQRRFGNQRGEGPVTGMNAARGHGQVDRRAGPTSGRPNGGVDIDALFGTPRESMASNSDEGDVAQPKSPAAILEQIGTLVKEQGVPAALAAMNVDDAIVLCKFNIGIDHLGEMTGTQGLAEENSGSSIRRL